MDKCQILQNESSEIDRRICVSSRVLRLQLKLTCMEYKVGRFLLMLVDMLEN